MLCYVMLLSSTTAPPKVAENPVSARHLRHFSVQNTVTADLVSVPHVKSELNLAETLTKLLPSASHTLG